MPASGRRAAQQTQGGVLYWVVFTTIYSINWEDDGEDRYLVEFEDEEAARSWEIPGGLPLGTRVPSLRNLERVPEDWMHEWYRDQKIHTPDDLLVEVRRHGPSTLPWWRSRIKTNIC